MAFDFAKVKTLVRRTVHKTFGVPAFYQDSSLSEPVEIRARWHIRNGMTGDLENQGYAEIMQSVERVVFEADAARAIPVRRGGILSFPDMIVRTDSIGNQSVPFSLVLNTPEPPDGPFNEVWSVTRLGG